MPGGTLGTTPQITYENVQAVRVGEVMTRQIMVVEPDTTVHQAMSLMTTRRCRHLPVLEDGRVIEHRSPAGRITHTTYDAFGRVVAVTDALGNITRTSYDAGGRPTVVRVFELAAASSPPTYTLLARTETRYDELGRAVRQVASRFEAPPPPSPRIRRAGRCLASARPASGHGHAAPRPHDRACAAGAGRAIQFVS